MYPHLLQNNPVKTDRTDFQSMRTENYQNCHPCDELHFKNWDKHGRLFLGCLISMTSGDKKSCNNKTSSSVGILSPAYGDYLSLLYNYMLKYLLAIVYPSVLASSIFVLLFILFCMSHPEPPLSTLCV